jgi:DNA-binding LacI/PurR family transcriptional regulator
MSQHTSLHNLSASHFAPKYVELAQRLLHEIAHQGLRAGDRLGTEYELVRKHGVSRVTVRQALSMLERDGYVSREKARGTFVKAAPSSLQQVGLVRGTVVVLCSNEQAMHAQEDFAFSTVLRAMERTLARRGFAVQILSIGEDEKADRARLEQLLSRKDLHGVCTIGPCLKPYQDLVTDVPVVTSCSFDTSTLPWVGQNVRAACHESIAYLLSRGHREIALLCGPWIDADAFALFAEGYRHAFRAAGVPARRTLLCHGYSHEPLQDLAAEVLTDPSRPTAIFAENWRVCEAVLVAAAKQAIRIPDDVSLVAYGQNVLQIASPVAVTTYVPDSEVIGARAAQCVADMIDQKPAPNEPIAIPGKLIERDSVRQIGAGSRKEDKR